MAATCLLIVVLLRVIAVALNAPARGDAIFVTAVFITAAVHWRLGFHNERRSNWEIILTFTVIGLQLALVGLAFDIGGHRNLGTGFALLLAPHALSPAILCMLAGRRLGLYAAVYGTLLGASLVEDAYALPFVATGLAIGFITVFASQRVRKRSRLLACGLYAGGVATLFMLLFRQTEVAYGSGAEPLLLSAPLLCGLVTSMLAGALLPPLESLFHMTTDISWVELADLNHPLMKRLSIEAPGTYHHSLVVANLAEAAAESIGANAGMCRVCSYFHDIGKLSKPEYFIENMNPDENPHDDLTARMSALVLIAHVKDGVDLALKHRLNNRIIDVIEQHHGNSLVYFFYRRALDQKKEIIRLVEQDKAREDDVPEVAEESYRYPGPKPQFIESAIISLADAVEGASRTMNKPTPARVEQTVEDIVRNRLLDRQLDECNLTLAQLSEVKASFVKTLLSMMHSRIRYPKEPGEATPTEEAQQEAREIKQEPPQAAA
jgi:putative nucleotidyltransferase with HDIG domain